MISVSIFILRDVIRRVRAGYKIPYNGSKHTSPSMEKELSVLREYLASNSIQTYCESRDGGDLTKPVRDLFTEGVKHANSASAFQSFCSVHSRATYRDGLDTNASDQQSDAAPAVQTEESEVAEGGAGDDGAEEDDAEDYNEEDLGAPTLDDVLDDEEEFGADADLVSVIESMRDMLHTAMDLS